MQLHKTQKNKQRAIETANYLSGEIHALHNELRSANRKILELEKSAIEEERLRLLLRMIGIAGHEMGQPLMALLGTISLIKIKHNDAEKLNQYIDKIETFGYRISDILKKIQTIRHEEDKSYLEKFSLSNCANKIFILTVEDSNEGFEALYTILTEYKQIVLYRTTSIESANQKLQRNQVDLIILDGHLALQNGIEALNRTQQSGAVSPVVVLTKCADELSASRLIRAGASNCLSVPNLNRDALESVIFNSIQKYYLTKEIIKAKTKLG